MKEKDEGKKTGPKKRRKIKRKYPLPASTLENDLLILKGLITYSEKGDTPVNYREIKININNTLISKELNFFSSIGLANEVSRGKYTPTPECIEFINKLDWDDQDAAKKVLRTLLEKTWFGDFAIKLLKVQKEIDLHSLAKKLGEECEADKELDKSAIKRLIKWLEYAGIVEIDENEIVHLKEVPTSQNVEEKLPPAEKMGSISETIMEEEMAESEGIKKVQKGILLNLTINLQIDSNSDIEKVREIIRVIKQDFVEDNNE